MMKDGRNLDPAQTRNLDPAQTRNLDPAQTRNLDPAMLPMPHPSKIMETPMLPV